MRGFFESTNPSLLGVVLFLLHMISAGATIHTLDDCASHSTHDYSVWGAEVYSQYRTYYTPSNNDCTLSFKAKLRDMSLLVQVLDLDIRPDLSENGECLDYITLVENSGTNSSSVLLSMYCGKVAGLPIDPTFYTSGGQLSVHWHIQGSEASGEHRGFRIIVTSVVQTSVPCTDLELMDCGGGNCVHRRLRCDGIRHCLNGQDENNCYLDTGGAPSNQGQDGTLATTTTMPAPTLETTPTPALFSLLDEKVYLWLPLIVVLMFTAAMVTLVLIGRRAHSRDGYRTTSEEVNLAQQRLLKTTPPTATTTTTAPSVGDSEEGLLEGVDTISIVLVLIVFALILVVCLILGWREKKAREREEQQLQLRVPVEASPLTNMNESLAIDINSNPAYGMGPPSPPPRYSYLERQTSFTSHISQTSDMLSIPPGYDEALDLPGNGASANGTRRSHLSRSSTGSSRRSRRPWLFSRSPAGPQEIRRNRHSTGNTSSSRPSSSTSSSDAGLPTRLSVDSNVSDVFAESPPSVISEESGEEENISPSLPPPGSYAQAMDNVIARMSGITDPPADPEVPPSPSTPDTSAPSGPPSEPTDS